MPEEINLPGGKKLPGWVLLAGGAVVVLILLMKKGGGEEEEGVQGDLLASELNQRFQEMQEALQEALDNAAENAPLDPVSSPSRPINPRIPPITTDTPEDDGLRPLPFPRDEPAPSPGIPRPGPGPGIPPTEPIPTRPGRTPAPEGTTEGLPPRSTTAILGTRTAHESRIRFIEEAGDDAAGIHREERARHEQASPILNMTNITARSQAVTGSRKAEREKKSPLLKIKAKPKTIKKQAPPTSQKVNKKGRTKR
jgi:hypothetical protein